MPARTPEGIVLVPAEYQDVLALLQSPALAAVEQTVAARCGLKILNRHDSMLVAYMQGNISVCGLTPRQLEEYLATHQDTLIAFSIRFVNDREMDRNEEEFAPGEKQDPAEFVETVGYPVGFGVGYAIYHHFLTQRPAADFRAYLKNRRMPKAAKFVKELARVLKEAAETPADSATD